MTAADYLAALRQRADSAVDSAMSVAPELEFTRISQAYRAYGLREALALAEEMLAEPEASRLPFVYQDDVVAVRLRAQLYPYGGGIAQAGVQLTLDQCGYSPVAMRLPREQARALALAILAGTEDEGGR